jgi:hypothetical protein
MRKPAFWALLATAAATLPVAGLFTLSRVFFVRDLSIAFRPRFLFLRHSIFSGTFPFWDPYPAHGQAAINDALYQLFHLPTLLIRLLLPETIAYNLWVALPVPVAAAGMYLFLRRHVTPPAAAFGGFAFAVSGPVVSSPNFPNLSWSICMVPFVFWALERLFERRSARRVALLAAMIACQALAGEPVTLFTTMVIAFAYASLPRPRRGDIRTAVLTGTALAAGGLLSAIQYVPLVVATRYSARNELVDADFWTFHPLALIELLVPHFFGDYFHSNLHQLAWMLALNSARDPFYYTMYVGVPIVLLGAVAMLSARPATRFWTAVIIICALSSLGAHTPLYPVLQAVVPVLRGFRFPVKYLTFVGFGLATLAAMALQWLLDGDAPRQAVRRVVIAAAVLSALTYLTVAWVLIAPELPIRGFYRLALWARVPSPIQGAEFLLYRARPLFSSLFLKLLCAAFLLWVAGSMRRERRLALGVLCAFAVVDLLASNSDVNPTVQTDLVNTPAWVMAMPQDMHERVYIGGRLEGYVNTSDEDAPKYAVQFEDMGQMEQRHMVTAEFLFQPSGARVRESMSYDLPLLWPIEFARTLSLFKISSKPARMRFLQRIGVRYAVLPLPPFPGARPLARMRTAEQMQLYEVNPQATRLAIVPDAFRPPPGVPSPVNWAIQGMFLERFRPADGVLVSETPPPPAGSAGPPVQPYATFIEDGLNRVVIRAGLPKEGYLALFDSYDPDWTVDVDGEASTVMRADGLFRAVHLKPGVHIVTFKYRPRKLYLGAAMTALTALILGAWCVRSS